MEITQQQFTAAKRTVARLAKQVREVTGEEHLKGFFNFVDPEYGTVGFSLELRYVLSEGAVLRAARELPNAKSASIMDHKWVDVVIYI